MKEDLLSQIFKIESAHPILNDEGFTLQAIYIVRAKYTVLTKLCQVFYLLP